MVAFANINDESGNVAVQIIPDIQEHFVVGFISRGGTCEIHTDKYFWASHYNKELSGTYASPPPHGLTRKSSVEIAFSN
jgi:hypothetical protein